MTRIHFISVGEASARVHLAGIGKFGADEVVVFTPANTSKSTQIVENLRKVGVPYRTVMVDQTYVDAYRKANEEAAASFANNSSLAVNASCRSGMIGSAIERAVAIQLYFFHKRNVRSFASAFLYFVTQGKRLKFDLVPVWNAHNEMHNDLVEMLIDAPQPMTVQGMWEIFQERPDPGGFEAFRKGFRDFRLWFKNLPCFKEELGKTPRYKLEM